MRQNAPQNNWTIINCAINIKKCLKTNIFCLYNYSNNKRKPLKKGKDLKFALSIYFLYPFIYILLSCNARYSPSLIFLPKNPSIFFPWNFINVFKYTIYNNNNSNTNHAFLSLVCVVCRYMYAKNGWPALFFSTCDQF